MIKAISTLLTESVKILLQRKLGTKDTQRAACQHMFRMYQILKQVRDEYKQMSVFLGYLKQIADDPQKDQWPVGFG